MKSIPRKNIFIFCWKPSVLATVSAILDFVTSITVWFPIVCDKYLVLYNALNEKFEWDKDGSSSSDPISADPAVRIKRKWVKKAISKIKC